MLYSGKINENDEIIIPHAVLDELQAQASTNREHGFVGLQEIKEIREECRKRTIKLSFSGKRPDYDDIQLAKHGRIDAIINQIALEEEGIIITADYVQHIAALAQGIESILIKPDNKIKEFKFEKFFSEQTMSVHLKDGVCPYAKIGRPGNFQLVRLDEKAINNDFLKELIKEIYEFNPPNANKLYEINREGANVIQFGTYRITITRPPFSDAIEITIVRPIVHLSLDDYKLSEKLLKRLDEKAEGIVIDWTPRFRKEYISQQSRRILYKKR